MSNPSSFGNPPVRDKAVDENGFWLTRMMRWFSGLLPSTVSVGDVLSIDSSKMSVWQPPQLSVIVGTITNDSAVAGNVGEFNTATVVAGSAVSLTTATSADVTTLSLTAGDWELSSQVDFTLTGTTSSLFQAGFGLVANTLPTQPGGGGLETDPLVSLPLSLAGITSTLGVPLKLTRFLIAAPAVIHLVAKATFTVGTVAAFGTVSARRVR